MTHTRGIPSTKYVTWLFLRWWRDRIRVSFFFFFLFYSLEKVWSSTEKESPLWNLHRHYRVCKCHEKCQNVQISKISSTRLCLLHRSNTFVSDENPKLVFFCVSKCMLLACLLLGTHTKICTHHSHAPKPTTPGTDGTATEEGGWQVFDFIFVCLCRTVIKCFLYQWQKEL